MKTNTHAIIVILADLRKIRALRLSPPGIPLFPHEGSATIEEIRLPKRKRNVDSPVRFAQGRPGSRTAGMSHGENITEEIEYERRRIKEIAGEITHILDQEDNGDWCLAAPDPINQRLVDSIPARCRDFLHTNIGADLTRSSLAEIERRFPPENSRILNATNA